MGYDVIHGISVYFKIVDSVAYLLMGRLFPFPPHIAVSAEVVVLTVTASESEYFFVLDEIDLTAHEVDYIMSNHVDFSAVP